MTSGSEAGVNKWAFAEKLAHGLWGKSDVRVNFRRLLRVVSQMSYVNLLSVRVRDFSHKNPKYPVVSKLLYSRLGDLVNLPCMSSFFIIFRWDFIISKNQYNFTNLIVPYPEKKANISRCHHWFPLFGGETSCSIAKCRLFSLAICFYIIQFHRIPQLLIRAFNFNLKFSGFLCFEISFIASVSNAVIFLTFFGLSNSPFSRKPTCENTRKLNRAIEKKTKLNYPVLFLKKDILISLIFIMAKIIINKQRLMCCFDRVWQMTVSVSKWFDLGRDIVANSVDDISLICLAKLIYSLRRLNINDISFFDMSSVRFFV